MCKPGLLAWADAPAHIEAKDKGRSVVRGIYVAAASAASVLVLASAGAALAGGSTFKFEQPQYYVGQAAFGVAPVSYSHNPELGTPEGGPYYLYLAPMTAVSPGRPWPSVPDGAVRVASVEFRRGPVEVPRWGTVREIAPGLIEVGAEEPPDIVGPDHVAAKFEVPRLDPGTYATIVCNDPCTSSIGDIVDGLFVIKPGQVEEEPYVTFGEEGRSLSRDAVFVASLLAAAGLVVLGGRRPRRRESG